MGRETHSMVFCIFWILILGNAYCLCKNLGQSTKVCLASSMQTGEGRLFWNTLGRSQAETPLWASVSWSFRPLGWLRSSRRVSLCTSGDILAHRQADAESEKNGLTYAFTSWRFTSLTLMSLSWTWRLTHWALFVEIPIFRVTSEFTWNPSMLSTAPSRLWRARYRWNQTWLQEVAQPVR